MWRCVIAKEPPASTQEPLTHRLAGQGLNNHTDQSVPAHGIPALLLVVNYIEGTGYNTLVDGYAVAQALRSRDPAAFDLRLCWGKLGECTGHSHGLLR